MVATWLPHSYLETVARILYSLYLPLFCKGCMTIAQTSCDCLANALRLVKVCLKTTANYTKNVKICKAVQQMPCKKLASSVLFQKVCLVHHQSLSRFQKERVMPPNQRSQKGWRRALETNKVPQN